MKIHEISDKAIIFKGIREDRNTAKQLKEDNQYSLTENNQKRISNSIENLGKYSGEKNIDFILDLADNLKYGTNIKTSAKPRNDWKLKLKTAVLNSLSISDPIIKEKYKPEIDRIFSDKKPLSPNEKEILKLKNNLLKNVDMMQLKNETNANIKNLEENLNAFIVSSEVPIIQKKYILNRLNYFLSPEYKINPELKDKKTVILAEMLNDLVVNTENSKVPNTKAINQKNHGMCAAISIARKLMSYEYKPDFIDTILSELDDSPNIMVYDLAHLGEHKKIPVQKTYVDFTDAIDKGYRIIDASTTQWMNIADMFGIDNKSKQVYTAFDPAHFGTFSDTHYQIPFNDGSDTKQSYYQSLLKAKENIDKAKINKLQKKFNYQKRINQINSDLDLISNINNELGMNVRKILPGLTPKEIHKTVSELLSLEKSYSQQIKNSKDEINCYFFIKNEENIIKEKKIRDFFKNYSTGLKNEEAIKTNSGKILELIEMSNSIKETIHPKHTISEKIRNDRNLFEAAAAYRTSMLLALYDDDLQTDFMIHYGIPDAETYLLDTIKSNIENVKHGNRDYIKYFSKQFGISADKKAILAILNEINSNIERITTENFDGLYRMLGVEGRKGALLNKISYAKEAVLQGDKDILNSLSLTTGISKNKVKILDKLNEYQKILEENPTEQDYREIYNKLGNKSQLEDFANIYTTVTEAITNPQDPENILILNKIKLANGIDEKAPIETLQPVLMDYAQTFNRISEGITTLRESLVVHDNDKNIISSANPNFLILKKMENEGRIIPIKELLALQKRYDAIDKIRSQDEFSSRYGKISDPALYKYTKKEQETLNKIQKSINLMSSDVNKELVQIYREIRKPLEEHSRKIGINMGMYWTMPEGTSGLYTFQQAKILQQLTDKPYYSLEDFPKAINKIKNGTHSGISGTHVFHDKPGAHAQYIAEIEERNGKDILFHDNTWGASEHENVWVDSEGLLRTDYSDRRGGEHGYITDEKWRNGNYVKDLTEKSGNYQPAYIESKQIKKLKGSDFHGKFPLLSEIIIPGMDDKKAEDLVASIKDNIFQPDSVFISNLESKASHMTLDEIKARRINNETAGKFYNQELNKINKRLEVTPFRNEIKSRADFEALPDDDNLKVIFEKAALDYSYDFIPIWKELAQINTVSGLDELRNKQKIAARENFDYAFAKSPDILLAYVLNKNKSHLYSILDTALKNNQIELNDQQKIQIFTATAIYSDDEKNLFDGSLKNTINFMVNKVLKQFNDVVPPSENAEKAKSEIKEKLTNDLRTNLYFSQKDLLKDTDKHEAIKKYIDRKFNPETDEDFVKIYRQLQDMTTTEFKELTKDTTNQDLAYKDITGYDILVKYRASNPAIKQEIANLVFQKHLLQDIDLPETEPTFQYKKLQKKVRGAIYNKGRTYDDLYRSFSFSLQSLNYEKLFNKYKDENYRKYKSFPAYPKIEVLNEKLVDDTTKILNSLITDTIQRINSKKINLRVYNLTDYVDKFLNKIPDNKKLTEKQRRILNNHIGEFLTENGYDQSITSSIESASRMLELSRNAIAGDYKQLFKNWKMEIDAIRKLNPSDELQAGIKNDVYYLKKNIDDAFITDIPLKYRNKLKSDLNKYINELEKANLPAYSRNLQFDKLKQQIASYMCEGIAPETREDFYNDFVLLLQNIKKLKASSENIKFRYKEFYPHFIQSIVEAEYALKIPQDCIDSFTQETVELCNKDNIVDNKDYENSLKNIIFKYSDITEEQLSNLKEFKKLDASILKYRKLLTASNRLEESLDKNTNKFNNLINNFVDKKIKPEYANTVLNGIEKYIRIELNGNKKQDFSQEKLDYYGEVFLKNYKKYNYMNNPQEILDRYIELCAKDSEITKAQTKEEKEKLIREKTIKKKYLNTVLTLASIVEMQNILMDATELGNSALAAYKFKNFDTGVIDEFTGTKTDLADPEAVNYMVRSLILDNNYTTSIMFVEKLGLTDKFLKTEDERLDVDKMKKLIDKSAKIIEITNIQVSILKDVLNKISYENNDNFSQTIEKAKKEFAAKTIRLPRQKNIKAILKALDDVKNIIEENPELSKQIMLNEIINNALDTISSETNKDLQKNQEDLKQLKIICEMIAEINVPEYREGYKHKQNILEKFNLLENYNSTKLGQIIQDSEALKQVED